MLHALLASAGANYQAIWHSYLFSLANPVAEFHSVFCFCCFPAFPLLCFFAFPGTFPLLCLLGTFLKGDFLALGVLGRLLAQGPLSEGGGGHWHVSLAMFAGRACGCESSFWVVAVGVKSRTCSSSIPGQTSDMLGRFTAAFSRGTLIVLTPRCLAGSVHLGPLRFGSMLSHHVAAGRTGGNLRVGRTETFTCEPVPGNFAWGCLLRNFAWKPYL